MTAERNSFHRWSGSPTICYDTNTIWEISVETVLLPKQGKDFWAWGIHLEDNDDGIIGAIDLWREGRPEHRGFWLGRQYWGRGIMTEAVAPIMDHAFDELGFETLIFCNAQGNLRSRRIKEKTGARLLRVEPGTFIDPAYTMQEIWELKKSEWQARQ